MCVDWCYISMDMYVDWCNVSLDICVDWCCGEAMIRKKLTSNDPSAVVADDLCKYNLLHGRLVPGN